MSITQTVCTSFKVQLLSGIHDFSSDTIKLALFQSTADLGASTTVYSSTGESSGTGYTAGGANLTVIDPVSTGTTAIVDFSDLTFSTVSLTARGALVYNSTKGNKAICVLDFGSDRIRVAADLVVTFPSADAVNAIIRIA
mgnify:FL=1|tara:strand:- start:1942 stop:2361 length:420 start_codon:yes stop_codon:yes gene_type:complete